MQESPRVLGKVFTHFSKPRKKHAVEKRLSRNVANEDIGTEIDKAILAEGAKHVRDGSLILVDPTEIWKEFGLRMEHVTMVRDASRSSKEGWEVLVHGYHGCMAVACQNGRRKTVPLALKLWSFRGSGTCSRRTSAEVGAGRIEKRKAPPILRSGSVSHTARSSSHRRKTHITLMKTHLHLYLSG